MANIRISTDSTADVPQALREELKISVLPLGLVAEGKEYLDGVTIHPEEFYRLLEQCDEIPTSAQVGVTRYIQLFEETLAAGYTHLIHVALNSKGSGTYQAGVMAVEMFFEDHPEARGKLDIQILDSRNYSMGYGIAVVEGARAVRDGKSPEEVLALIRDYLAHLRVIVVPMNLKFVKKSGRISAAAAFLGDAIGLKPFITFIDGEAEIPNKVRGESKAVAALVEEFASARKAGTPYAIAHGNDLSFRDAVRDGCVAATGEEPLAVYPLGCVIAINIGPDAVGVIYYRK